MKLVNNNGKRQFVFNQKNPFDFVLARCLIGLANLPEISLAQGLLLAFVGYFSVLGIRATLFLVSDQSCQVVQSQGQTK